MTPPAAPKISIMPTSFGAAGGPRQAPDHADFRPGPIKFTRYVVRFLGRADQLGALLPKGLALRGEPMAQFHFFCLRDIPWLAGRGYNILSLMIPVTHKGGTGETVDGVYTAVMWENLGDPIITGREQLGHPKLYAQLPDPRRLNGETHIRASWEGFTFAELQLSCETPADPVLVSEIGASVGAGIIAHKYIPRSGQWDVADADYLTLSPVPGTANMRDPQPAPSVWTGTGSIRFNLPQWQDMPTQYHIVAKIAALEQCAALDALIMEGTTYLDFSDQTILS
ncbi:MULTISPECIES: acetoacetate decarboxylase family protein [unclassified Sphingomonas]|uniref:acetoacetate decarboxylase family protein n=1 Tax=unclassified Sphingomonas TaxID=196159 RepID=UPI000B083BA0|nr:MULTISPECIES: acetoacetate decarboxylase family protein [unclassified Sphingomonas]